MKAVDKLHLLNTLEGTVRKHLQVAHHFLDLSTTILLAPSSAGGWSIAQCIEHLNRYGQYYLPRLQGGLEKQGVISSPATFTSTWLGNYFTRMMQPDTGKRKVKAFKAYTPPAGLNAYGVVKTFIAQQETLLALLSRSREADLAAIRVPLSIAPFIKFRMGDALQFLIAHNERHIRQALRNDSVFVAEHNGSEIRNVGIV